MEAVAYDARNKCVELIYKDFPKIENPRQILIKVSYAGVCGTDLHVIQVRKCLFKS